MAGEMHWQRQKLGDTWLDREELAYNVALDRSPRRALVRCSDGKLRMARVGIPDTFFSIPARVRVRGRTVAGFVSVKTASGLSSGPDAEFYFNSYTYRKNGSLLP